MEIKQFYDEGLAHASYAILSEGKVAVVDPARNPQPYLDFAKAHDAAITAVFETHPHADFVSSHMEIHQQTDATIYVSGQVGAEYPHTAFDEGMQLRLGKLKFEAIHTPGHSPDSISILLYDAEDKQHALFSGDTLFIGDVGRPDLREKAGNLKAQRKELAAMMYDTVQEKLKPLADHIKVFPAHGAGSLCGKNLSDKKESTIGEQRKTNWAFGDVSKEDFMDTLLEGQPYIPKYFGYNVSLNKDGAPAYAASLNEVERLEKGSTLPENSLIIDARSQEKFAKGHIPGAINLMNGGKFETWLGSIIDPEEKFYLVADNDAVLDELLAKAAKIGYELNIAGTVVDPAGMDEKGFKFDLKDFKQHPDNYTIIDIRTKDEHKNQPKFEDSLNLPLHELRENLEQIDTSKPVVVHCAGGYRSAAGTSILLSKIESTPVYDLSEAIKEFN